MKRRFRWIKGISRGYDLNFQENLVKMESQKFGRRNFLGKIIAAQFKGQ